MTIKVETITKTAKVGDVVVMTFLGTVFGPKDKKGNTKTRTVKRVTEQCVYLTGGIKVRKDEKDWYGIALPQD